MTGLPQDLLVFRLEGGIYALDAALVRRTLWLPELSPVPEAPPGIIGRFNLQGEIVPVADLALRLDRRSRPLSPGDQVVVLDLDGTAMGIVVGEVLDLAHPFADPAPPLFHREEQPPGSLVAGTLQLGDDLVTLLDIRQLPRTAGLEGFAAGQAFDQAATPEEQALYRSRAQALREAAVADERSDLALAVVELEGQYFGIDLAAVREFCQVPALAPIPCCPPHVAWVFNLRGHLITLLEISSAFDLPAPAAPRPKAVIAWLDGEAVGVAVDDVVDVFNPQVTDLRPVPSNLVQENGVEIRAIAAFSGRRVLVLDLAGLLRLERWVVNETIA